MRCVLITHKHFSFTCHRHDRLPIMASYEPVRPSFLTSSASRRPSSTFMSASATPTNVSRRSSYANASGDGDDGNDDGVSANDKVTKVHDTLSGSWTSNVNLSKMRNPTIELRFGTSFCVELTYAALLHYLSIVLCIPRTTQLFRHSFTYLTTISTALLVIATGTLEARQKSEKLGLRRTSLLFCTLLCLAAFVLALWPAKLIVSEAPLYASPTSVDADDHQQRSILRHIDQQYGSLIDALCDQFSSPKYEHQVATSQENLIYIRCKTKNSSNA